MDAHLVEARQGRETAGTTATPTIGDLDDATAVFVRARPGLLKIANRIVGNASEAEDVIQEAWLRWQGTDRTVVSNPPALLRTTTVRLAINVVQSAWRRRESCASPWLPELLDTRTTPEAAAERQDAVERAVLLLMEALTPRQRAAYVLREGFGYPHSRISEILCLSAANTRQQVTRAHERLAQNRRGQPVDSVAHRRLVQAFLVAAQSGDLAQLERVLSADADHRSTCGPMSRAASESSSLV
ncbi:sigma-70 family RNA polymerase sigma factor [Streptomyces sp. NBC_01275]|uniref:sigma-70 family RNA polymerase sigma factor n=1 Tax=Streptomyces sp. NBC_01275 TaxID=2903807 RepID=UPI002256E604|nr:sigma-70 family RNA polymerase sigma factor [Streptomyces sp. NBC_01275]MCX4766763.1 sigma-70 family RNA polymerase sigma factor [Streptomyces sp. NBC_01275]